MDEPVKKKRGRKPKSITQTGEQNETNKTEQKVKKKRGRKPKQVFIMDQTDLKIDTDEQVILHLPINSQEKPNKDFVPEPFDISNELYSVSSVFGENLEVSPQQQVDQGNHLFLNISSIVQPNPKEDVNDILEELSKQRQQEINYSNTNNEKISYIFLDYLEYNFKQTWPSSTRINCLWCCEEFDNEPYGIPMSKQGDTFQMFGNFCSPQCAAAYIFDQNDNTNELWERYSLLNFLYGSAKDKINIALPRLALKKFGGPFTIDEWKKKSKCKCYKVIMPPMISIIPTLEEITIDSDNSFFQGINSDFINKTSNDLRLKRSNPLPNHKNTLENCMNLKLV
jgi:hypothetical protein